MGGIAAVLPFGLIPAARTGTRRRTGLAIRTIYERIPATTAFRVIQAVIGRIAAASVQTDTCFESLQCAKATDTISINHTAFTGNHGTF